MVRPESPTSSQKDVGSVEKSGALLRYGQEVIQEFQLKAELQKRPGAAKTSQ